MPNLTLDQIIYYNGISKTIEVEGKKVVYSVSITYDNDNSNLLTSKVTLSLKQNKKVILNINFDKLRFNKENKNNFKDASLDLSIFKELINNLSVDDLDQIDQNLFIICQLIKSFVPIDDNNFSIVRVPKNDFFKLVVETGKKLEKLNTQHTLEFSLLYKFSLLEIEETPLK